MENPRPERAWCVRTGAGWNTKQAPISGTAERRKTKRSGMSNEKSETPTVPVKPGNSPHEDPLEGRGVRKTEPREGKMSEPLNSGSITTKLARIAELAREQPERVFRSLHHVI